MLQSTMANPVGRPLLFDTGEALSQALAKAIEAVVANGKPMVVENIAIELDCSASTLRKYGERTDARPDFLQPIKKMLDVCQAFQVSALYGGGQVAGAIFALKNNYPDEYRDKTEVDSIVVADVTSNGETVGTTDLDTIIAQVKKSTEA